LYLKKKLELIYCELGVVQKFNQTIQITSIKSILSLSQSQRILLCKT